MRPAGQARIALLAVLQAGNVGAFDVLANAAGVPAHQARQTLGNMRREGVVQSRRHANDCIAPQRVRAVYALASHSSPFDALAYMRQAWR